MSDPMARLKPVEKPAGQRHPKGVPVIVTRWGWGLSVQALVIMMALLGTLPLGHGGWLWGLEYGLKLTQDL